MKLLHIKTHKQCIVRLALIALPLATLSSCDKDFLDAVPETSVPEPVAFDTPTRVESQVNGLYFSLKHGRFLGGRYQIYNDIRAEEFVNRQPNNVTGYDVWQHTNNANNVYTGDFWTYGYLGINRVNLFLKGLADNPDVVSAEVAANYRGEAKFVRALSYFSLVQVFAPAYSQNNGSSPGLPLRLTPETTTANNALRRSSVAEVYAQILKDLNEAESELPETYGNATLRTVRAHKNTAIALKSRVKLVMGDYQGVIAEANKIVPQNAPFTAASGVPHALQGSIASVFSTPYNTVESIFSLPMAETNVAGTQNQLGYYYNGGNGNREYYLNTGSTGILSNPQFGANDARRTTLTSVISGQRYLIKYTGISPFLDWAPVIRYSEVLLNLAEAEARVGSQERALALLKAVHHRSDPTYDFGALSGQALIDAILTERRIELLGEGFRFNDIARTGQPIVSVGANASIPATDARYLFPVPVNELQNNPEF